MEILEKDAQRLLEIEGIGPKKLAVITESFYEEKQINDIAYDLEQHGVAGRYAGRLLQKVRRRCEVRLDGRTVSDDS